VIETFRVDLVESFKDEFYYSVYNQCESFIYLNLIIKNRVITIER
jgi:hypothetical protein